MHTIKTKWRCGFRSGSSNPGWSTQLKVTDVTRCREVFLQQRAWPRPPDPTSGPRLFTLPLPTRGSAVPRWPRVDKNKEITATWVFLFCCPQSSGSAPADYRPSNVLSTVLVSERWQGDIRLLFGMQTRPQVESIIQWKKQELQHLPPHPGSGIWFSECYNEMLSRKACRRSESKQSHEATC